MRRHPVEIGAHTLLNLFGGEHSIRVPPFPHLSSALAKVGGWSQMGLLPAFLPGSCVIWCAAIGERFDVFSFPALEELRTHGIGVGIQTGLGHHRVEISNGSQEHVHTTLAQRRRAGETNLVAIECRITADPTAYIVQKECFHRATDLFWGSVPGGIVGKEVGKKRLQKGEIGLPGAIRPRLFASSMPLTEGSNR